MTLQMLDYFIAVAKYRNFTKAAEECFVTQPALSRAIRDLEKEIGCPLFARTSRQVDLTAAGESCLMEAKRITSLCRKLPEKVLRSSLENAAPLKIGYLIYDHLMTFIQRLSDRYGSADLPFTLDSCYCTGSEAKRLFAEGELDALLLPEPCIEDIKDAESIAVQHVKMGLFIPKSNPLSEKKIVLRSELIGQRFIGWNPQETPLLQAAYVKTLRDGGVEPNIIGYADKFGDMAIRLLTMNALGFASTVSHRSQSEDLSFATVEDSPETFGVSLVWHHEESIPSLNLIFRLLSDSKTNL